MDDVALSNLFVRTFRSPRIIFFLQISLGWYRVRPITPKGWSNFGGINLELNSAVDGHFNHAARIVAKQNMDWWRTVLENQLVNALSEFTERQVIGTSQRTTVCNCVKTLHYIRVIDLVKFL